LSQIATKEEENQTDSSKIFNNFIIYCFGVAFVFTLTTLQSNSIDHSTLEPRLFDAILLLFIISTALFLLSFFVYSSSFVFQIIRHKSMTKKDLSAIAKEQRNPTKDGYKIRRVLLWITIGGTILTLVARFIINIVAIAISIYS